MTEPTVAVPVTLLLRTLEVIPRRPCCSDVYEGHCYCPMGMLRHELQLALQGAPEGAMPEPAGERCRRLAG